jgi:hypothetical protein
MPHENPIIRAFDELLYGNGTIQERVKAVTDAYAAADLDAWAQFVESLSEKAFDFLESQYGHRGTAAPISGEGVVPPPLPWVVAADQTAPTTQVAELERVEAAYEASIETHGEDVAGNVLEGWRDELGDIRLRLEKARAAIADTGEPSSLEVEAKLYGDSIAMYGEAADPEVLAAWQERLARIRAEIEDFGRDEPDEEEEAPPVADVVEADNAGEQLGEPPTEGEGTEASLPDGTLATEEDGTPLETPAEAAASDEAAEDVAGEEFDAGAEAIRIALEEIGAPAVGLELTHGAELAGLELRERLKRVRQIYSDALRDRDFRDGVSDPGPEAVAWGKRLDDLEGRLEETRDGEGEEPGT